MFPVFELSSFIQSDLEKNVFYVIADDPNQKFELMLKTGPVLMKATRHFVDRGAPCVEYRPIESCPDLEMRVRFYPSPNKASCGVCDTCSCKRNVIGEDAGL